MSTRDTDKALRKITFGKGGRYEQRKGTSTVPSVNGLDRARQKERGKTRAPRGKRQSGSPKTGNPFERKSCGAKRTEETEEPRRRTLGSNPPV